MYAHEPHPSAICRSDLHATRRNLQEGSFLLSLPALYVAGFALIVGSGRFEDPLQGGVPGLMLLVLSSLVLTLYRVHYVTAAWLLVAECILVIWLLVVWSGMVAAISLLAIPVGLALLFVGTVAGTLVALACSFLLMWLPTTDVSLKVVALVQIWSMIWLVWLTSRPLLTAMAWFQSSYQQSRSLLEQARDARVQLSQTLEDLAEANLQLTRMNRFAHAQRQRAEDARLAKEQFVSNVSHELRTPLNMIIGFIEMIMQSPKTYSERIPDVLLADLDIILRNSRHLSSLIDDVLDLSQIDTGEAALTRESVLLREIVDAAVTAVRPLFNSKQLYLQVDVPVTLPPIYCDLIRIRQVVLNLLSNAGRFTERGGVCVRAWQEGAHALVSVADTGPGIARQHMEKVFQPFQQLDGSIRRQHGGSGLGLSISRGFVELHGGKMWVESEQGQGATFYFRLPISGDTLDSDSGVSRWFSPYVHYQERIHGPSLPVRPDRPRLVVLETGNALCRLLTRYLKDVEIVPVASLETALDEIARVPAQALLVNTETVADSLQQMETSISLPFGLPAIVCSVPGIQESAGALGVSDYLIKPIARDALLAALDRLPMPNRTVLVVDDDPDALQLFRRMLVSAQRGYRVLRAMNGHQALEVLGLQRPDVVLLDLIMPGMDGFQLIAEMKKNPALAEIPVVVISAQDPAGQPIISKSLAVIRGGGISIHRLLATVEALVNTLAVQQVSLGIQGDQEDLAADGLAQEGSRA